MSDKTTRHLLSAIAAKRGDLIGLTQDLIRIPTLNPPGQNYLEICEYLADRLGRAGFKIDLIRAEGAWGDSAAHPRWNLVARHQGQRIR